MTPAELSRTVRRAVCRAVEDDALPGPVPERVMVERPRPGGRGDYATNIALRLAGPAGRPPREVAEIVRASILRSAADAADAGDHRSAADAAPATSPCMAPGIDRIEITGPGFLNFTLARDSRVELVRTILRAGPRYGHGDALAGTSVLLAPSDEPRAALWTRTVVELLRTQGARAEIVPGAGAVERLRPVPAPADDDLFVRLGPDAARWGLLRPAVHDRPLTGADLLAQRESNPLFRVRYAYARTRALARNAAHLGITPDRARAPIPAPTPDAPPIPEISEISGITEITDPVPEITTDPGGATALLLTALGDHPTVLEAAARLRAPDRLARHLEQTADAFLRFQETCRPLPLGDEKPSAAHRSRLALADATGTVLAGGLSLLGIDAPAYL
ncbi:ArgS-related anticodon-binding protein NrtL [Streptomyces sp. NPDC094034]|uniref:ArgS-related anticodon-binding protein NrtL n=1 Tax=Streptomyces sp. NPDC094034 TaxID=3155309 RepID=UPI00331B386F